MKKLIFILLFSFATLVSYGNNISDFDIGKDNTEIVNKQTVTILNSTTVEVSVLNTDLNAMFTDVHFKSKQNVVSFYDTKKSICSNSFKGNFISNEVRINRRT